MSSWDSDICLAALLSEKSVSNIWMTWDGLMTSLTWVCIEKLHVFLIRLDVQYRSEISEPEFVTRVATAVRRRRDNFSKNHIKVITDARVVCGRRI